MANGDNFIKAEKVAKTALGLLEREIVLPGLVWKDAAGDFDGAKGDTISIRLPAYVKAQRRNLRSDAPIVTGEIHEQKVDLTLDTHIYTPVHVRDSEMTLDIEDFGAQVLTPVVASVARELENLVAEEMAAATYQTALTFDPDTQDIYNVLVTARSNLNKASVPMGGRRLVVGADMEAAILTSDQFKASDLSDESALREAQIGRIAGFDVFTIPGIDPDIAVAFHQTAFALSTRAPIVPAGAGWGASQAFSGLAIRALRDYDFTNVRDRLLSDIYAGVDAVKDTGHFDAEGRFEPVLDPADPVTGDPDPLLNDTARLVRAVKITLI